MPEKPPLSPLILWVTPILAQACERLTVREQEALAQELTDWLRARLPAHLFRFPSMADIERMSQEEFAAILEAWSRHFSTSEDDLPF